MEKETRTTRVLFTIRHRQLDDLDKKAKRLDMSRSEAIRDALRDWISKSGEK